MDTHWEGKEEGVPYGERLKRETTATPGRNVGDVVTWEVEQKDSGIVLPACYLFTPREMSRLRFARYLVEQGRFSEEVKES